MLDFLLGKLAPAFLWVGMFSMIMLPFHAWLYDGNSL